jgi:arabinose-5-phosphate isomerase
MNNTPIRDVMTSTFKSISGAALASEAAKLMQDNEIYTLVVTDTNDEFCGIITMHDLLKANVV